MSATQSPLIIQLSDQPLEGTPLPQSPRVYALHLRAKSNREQLVLRVKPQQRMLQNDPAKAAHSPGHTHDCGNRFRVGLHVSEGELLLGLKQISAGIQKEAEPHLGAVLNTPTETSAKPHFCGLGDNSVVWGTLGKTNDLISDTSFSLGSSANALAYATTRS